MRHMKSRNNGRNVSACIFAKVPIVPPVCGKRIQETLSLGQKLQPMTGAPGPVSSATLPLQTRTQTIMVAPTIFLEVPDRRRQAG